MKRVQLNIKVAELRHAEWNPRSEEEMQHDHPEMVKLIASVREVGIVQPIAVWNSEVGMLVVAGNRRFEAAIAVGLMEVPALVFSGIDERQAREITRVENEVRIGVDPIRDAELVGSMLDLGWSQKEIAARFGVSEATVCRRAKLISLVPELREIGLAGKVDTLALECMAAYPENIQRECADYVRKCSDRGTVSWRDVEFDFTEKTMDLDCEPVELDVKKCVKCSKRTGACPDLWGTVDGKLGRCLDSSCYKRRVRDGVISRLKANHAADEYLEFGVDANISYYDASCSWGYLSKFFGPRRTAKRKAIWFEVRRGSVDGCCWVYGPDAEQLNEIVAKHDRDEERREKDRKAEEDLRRKREADRAEAEKNIERLRTPVLKAYTDLFTSIAEKWREIDDDDLAKALDNGIIGDSVDDACRVVFCEMIAHAAKCYDYPDEDEWLPVVLMGCPKLVERFGFDSDDVAAMHTAWMELKKFDAEHPQPK